MSELPRDRLTLSRAALALALGAGAFGRLDRGEPAVTLSPRPATPSAPPPAPESLSRQQRRWLSRKGNRK